MAWSHPSRQSHSTPNVRSLWPLIPIRPTVRRGRKTHEPGPGILREDRPEGERYRPPEEPAVMEVRPVLGMLGGFAPPKASVQNDAA
jgi:hypothetical protein